MKNSREDYLAKRVDELRADLLRRDPAVLADHIGAEFNGSQLVLQVWGQNIFLDKDELTGRDQKTGQPVNGMTQALLAYHLHSADGRPASGSWIAFSELSDGQFYASAFQGYTGNELVKQFGNDLDFFHTAAVDRGGQPFALGDAAYRFQVLPLVPVLVVAWQGDEDFPPSYRLLFDSNVSHHLPTDACAIVGSTLTRHLLKSAKKIKSNNVHSEGFSPDS